MMDWFEIKNWLEMTTGLDRDSLHIYGAVGAQLLAALTIRRPIASIWPWTVALTVTLANEIADLSQFENWSDVPSFFREAVIRDIWNSMLLPTVLFLVSRFFPSLLVSGISSIKQPDENSQDLSDSE